MGADRQTIRKVDGLRFELPAGVATVIGALPFAATDASAFVLDALPQLPSAPAVELDATHLDVASVSPEVRAGLVAPLSELRGRTEPIVMSLTGPVTLALDLRRHGVDDDTADRVVPSRPWRRRLDGCWRSSVAGCRTRPCCSS